MIERYITIPVKACRKVDSHHMILGMRWEWISNSDIVSGWEQIDVFQLIVTHRIQLNKLMT